MTAPRTFAIITPEILTARISDRAFRIYAIIYAINYGGIRAIPDKDLADYLRVSVVTVNRAVNELRKADLIKITFDRNRRYLTIERSFDKCVVDSQEPKTRYDVNHDGVPEPLKRFFSLWGEK